MRQYSLNELGTDIEAQDLLLEGRMTIQVDVSIERQHMYVKDTDNHAHFTLGKGWLVSLILPPRETSNTDQHPFADGETQMISDLKYMENDDVAVQLADAIRALGVDRDARIWTVKEAP